MNVAFLSNIDMRGCGYLRISLPLLDAFDKIEGTEVKLLGYQYNGEPHDHEYSIIPVQKMRDAIKMVYQMNMLWKLDWLVIALDIPNITDIVQAIHKNVPGLKVAGVFPVESGPMSSTWGYNISMLDAAFCISKFGTEMCKEHAANTRWLPMGLDPLFCDKDKAEAREELHFPEDDFIVLTVADNQERKNLSASMNIVNALKHKIDANPNVKDVTYVLITREKLPVGWKLRDYWEELDSEVDFKIVERGISDEVLNTYYNAADVFLITSKAEGWCMPVAESIQTRTPVVGGDHSGIKEQVELSKFGTLVPAQFVHRDVWQNANRYYIDEEQAVKALYDIYLGKTFEIEPDYETQLNWDISAKILYGELSND